MPLFLPTATRAEVETDVALYIGLAVACVVFAVVSALIYRLFRRKGRDHSMYNMAVSGMTEILLAIIYNVVYLIRNKTTIFVYGKP